MRAKPLTIEDCCGPSLTPEEIFRRRFWSHARPADDCLIWKGRLSRHGAGKVRLWNGTTALAHRVADVLTHGALAENVAVRQVCGRRSCVRPEHLARVYLPPAVPRVHGPRRRKKLTPADIAAIRLAHARGAREIDLAFKYKVDQSSICYHVHGRQGRRARRNAA